MYYTDENQRRYVRLSSLAKQLGFTSTSAAYRWLADAGFDFEANTKVVQLTADIAKSLEIDYPKTEATVYDLAATLKVLQEPRVKLSKTPPVFNTKQQREATQTYTPGKFRKRY